MRTSRRDRLWLCVTALFAVAGVLAAAGCALPRSSGPREDATSLGTSVGASVSSSGGRASPVPFRRGTGRPTRVLFAGDSLTAGFFASSSAAAFPALVDSWIGLVDVTSAQRAQQTLSTVSAITEVPPGLDLAVIELGTNDLGRTDVGDFSTQYRMLVQRIRSTSPMAAIVCLGVWSQQPGAYDSAVERQCTGAGGAFISIAALFADPSNHGPAGLLTPFGPSDTFHPNDRGHRAIAGAVVAHLEQRDQLTQPRHRTESG